LHKNIHLCLFHIQHPVQFHRDACGRFEGFFEYNLNAWDVAAGAFIVQQAGGKVTDFLGGNNYIFGNEIAAACGVHDEMISVIQKHWN